MSDELDDLLKRIEILSNEKYKANQELRLQKDLATKAQALAASRLELLRDVEHEFENLGKCLICHSSDKMNDKLWHADGCKLAKELGE